MAIGVVVSHTGLLNDDARRGIATLYAKLLFPTMVFRGVAAINLTSIDPPVVFVALTAKLLVATICIVFGKITFTRKYGHAAGAHAAMVAMAASHSFDVTWGLPLARLLYPNQMHYIYLNQAVQLVVVNPILLVLMELGTGVGRGSKLSLVFIGGILQNPLVVMTVAGLLAGWLYPAGLPPVADSISMQVASAGETHVPDR